MRAVRRADIATKRLTNLAQHLARRNSRSSRSIEPPLWPSPLAMNSLSSSSGKDPRSVACLIIGDEVLGGKTQDTNSHYLARKCFAHGLNLRRIETVADEFDDIIERVRYLSERFAHVITSGGIGPTHDDITDEAISRAFNQPLAYHQPTIDRMTTWMNDRIRVAREQYDTAVAKAKAEGGEQPKAPDYQAMEMNESRKRMALFPTGDKSTAIYPAPSLWVPVVVVNGNVAILPGVPRLFRELADTYIEKQIVPNLPQADDARPWIRKLVGTSKFEGDIADDLTEVHNSVKSLGIKVGSYPKSPPSSSPVTSTGSTLQSSSWKLKVVVSLVGKEEAELQKWAEVVRDKLDGWFLTDEEAQGE
ncbi:Molybdopterin binding protein [Gonapodya prolifera JEL478]|uniref:Molybdopterin binding protein n=1 Tax=Gonapodya prolifera (strain JEL478) TaxID=1344416 RepID=A0A139AMR7_GONPJ|nr:Molybdopterin binding protein [Gonapodya prolifera JEL478]|eukprot:KXS18051.1 Molybdopterin binding protein [Gonapodya prolifera JEL478]